MNSTSSINTADAVLQAPGQGDLARADSRAGQGTFVSPVGSVLGRTALASYVLLFLGYPVFSELLKYLGKNPVEIGYFTKAALLAFGLYAMVALWVRGGRFRINAVDLFFLIYLAYISAINAFGYAHGYGEIGIGNFSFILKFACIYLIARSLDVSRFGGGITWMFYLFSAFVIAKSLGNDFTFYYGPDPGVATVSEYDYQGTGLCYIAMFFLVVARQQGGLLHRLFIYGLCVLSLLFIGARSELLGVMVSIAFLEFLLARSKFFFLVMALVVMALGAAVIYNYPWLLGERGMTIVQLFSGDIILDRSALERLEFSYRAMEAIAGNPVMGDFASYPPGEYAHNVLSIWVDYGVFGFLLAMFLFMVVILAVLVQKREMPRQAFVFCFFVLFFLVFMLGLAKNYNFQLIPVGLGLISAILFSSKRVS